MTADWSPLDAELAAWRAAGLTLPLWWRDDDAVAVTPALNRLHDIAQAVGISVHLAVIPARAEPALADWISVRALMVPVVHGWAHRSHATGGDKKAEFGAHRSPDLMLKDSGAALDRLTALFTDRLCPVFVPPWNRIDTALFAPLARQGYRAVSTFTPRKHPLAAEGLAQVNTHLDPIDWRGSRSLVPPDQLLAQLVRQLQDRRTGQADNDEPYGLLTHHLVHDPAIWHFTEDLLRRLADGPVRLWSAQSLEPKDSSI